MEQLLSFLCCELDCYLDELKGTRRGDVSVKRRVAILVLLLIGVKTRQIATLLHKNESSITTAKKIASFDEKLLAEKLLLNYYIWLRGIKN